MSELIALSLLLAMIGVDEAPQVDEAPRIDPSRVTSLDARPDERMALNIFQYDLTDARGWPASAEHRRFIRYLQDSGVEVAFQHDPSGLHYVLIFESDFNRFLVLLNIAKQQRIPVPNITHQGVRIPPPAEPPAPTPMWFNVTMLIGTVAVLAWAFSKRDETG